MAPESIVVGRLPLRPCVCVCDIFLLAKVRPRPNKLVPIQQEQWRRKRVSESDRAGPRNGRKYDIEIAISGNGPSSIVRCLIYYTLLPQCFVKAERNSIIVCPVCGRCCAQYYDYLYYMWCVALTCPYNSAAARPNGSSPRTRIVENGAPSPPDVVRPHANSTRTTHPRYMHTPHT